MSKVTEHFFDDKEQMFSALTKACAERLTQAVSTQGKASFMVSGGSTPKPLYQNLAEQALPWSDIQVALVDERWVPPTSPSSNQAFCQNSLLQHNAKAATFIPMKTAHDTAKAGLSTTTKAYSELAAPFDITILGMGGDGHTASIFPNCEGIEQALDANSPEKLSAIMAHRSEVTGDNLERITLSLSGILDSKFLVLLITGDSKREVYQQALTAKDSRLTPISAVLQQTDVPVHVYWAP